MYRRATLILTMVIALGAGTAGCYALPPSPALAGAADALGRASDECLIDVRDRRQTWEQSVNCGSLERLASAYIAAGGFQHESSDVGIVAERARSTAWTARATSLAGGAPLRIW